MTFRQFLFIPAILILLGLSACDTPEENYADHIEKGQAYYEAGDFVKARLEYKNAAQIIPADHHVIYYLGLVEEAEGNIQSALSAYLTAEQQQPDFEPVLLKLAQFFLAAKQYDEVRPRVDKILSLNPNNATAYAIRGSVYLGTKKFQDAQRAVDKAMAIDSKDVIANAVQVGLYMAQDNDSAALELLDKAIRATPQELSYHLLKATIYNEQGDIDAVIATYNAIFEIYPEQLNFRIDLARILETYNKPSEIEKLYRQTVRDFPENLGIKRNLTLFLEQEKGLDVAEAEIQTFAQNNPDQKVFYLWLSDLYIKNDQNDKAIATLKSVLDSNPDDLIGLNANTNLARIELKSGDLKLAENLINTVLAKDANNQDALLLRANLAFSQGDYQKAVSDLRTIIQFGTDTLRASRILAEALLIQDRIDLAVDTLIQAAKQYPNSSETMIRLAQLYALRGNPIKAEEILTVIAKNDPQNPLILETMARLLIQTKQLDRAKITTHALSNIEGQNSTASYLNALILDQSGNANDAIDLYKTVIKNDPTAPIAAYALSSLMQGINDESQLIDIKDFLLSLEQKDAVIYTVIGGIEESVGQTLQAEQSFRMAIANTPTTQAPFISLARIIRDEGQIDAATEVLLKAETAIPHEIKAPIMRAQILMNAGDIAQTIAIYETLLERNSNNDAIANNFAHIIADYQYQDIAKLEQARLIAERFINSENPYYLDTLGWVYYRQNQYAQAENILSRAVTALDTPNPQIYYHYGATLLAVGKKAEAKPYLEQALADDADYVGRKDAQQLLKTQF